MTKLFWLFFCLGSLTVSAQKKTVTRPNIIFIIGDDISIDDIGCYGNSKIKTPNLDRLAAGGLQFNNMFVTSSSCSPSRTSILTGRYPHNTGAAELHVPLPGHLTYFPELLKKAGYYTALAGKWHEGKNTARAYDTVIAGEQHNGPGGEAQWLHLFSNRPSGKPFFFWLSPFDAHRSWSADTFVITHHPETEVMVPATLVNDEATRKDLASYYNEISRLDYHVGQLYEALKQEGALDNTIIVFMADNARAFPGSKTRLNDRGLKTPFIFYWPKAIQQHYEVNALVSSIDIAPTFLQLAGAKAVDAIQGVSFARLLTAPGSPFRHYIFGEHNWHDYEAYERSVRSGHYLYIYNGRPVLDNGGPIDANQSPAAQSLKNAKLKNGLSVLQSDAFVQPRPREELYELTTDSLQIKNLAGDSGFITQLEKYRQLLQQWQRDTGDTEPAQLTPDWYDRNNGQPLPAKGTRKEMPGAAKRADYNNKKGIF